MKDPRLSIPNPLEAMKSVSPEQAIEDLGQDLAVCINFVPQMLVAVAIDACLHLAYYARDMKISEIKQECFQLRRIGKAWVTVLEEALDSDTMRRYAKIIEKFAEFSEGQRWLAFQKIEIDARNQVCGDPMAAAFGEWFRLLYKEIQEFDKKMDEKYYKYVNRMMRNGYHTVLALLNAEVHKIRQKGYTMLSTPEAWPAPGVIRNKAWEMGCKLDEIKV